MIATHDKVRIGVSGHRVLTDVDKIKGGVDAAFERIAQAFPGRLLALISPLAEGADCLVAEQALQWPDCELIVALPLPEQEYLADYESPDSREQFRRILSRAEQVIQLPRAPTRTEAYRAAGRYVLSHIDVLIAVWDGQEAQGEAGTGTIVALARRLGLPIAWVHAGNRKPGTMKATSLGKEQGSVTFEKL